MSITLTQKFADRIDERFAPATVTAAAVNNDYTFEGAKTIKVTSITTATMGDYDRNAGYGAAQHLSNEIQEMTMTKDRYFKVVLDQMDEEESKIKAGEVLARQLREVIHPEIEAYRFGVMLANVPTEHKITGAGTAYERFLSANEKLDEADVPAVGRVAFVSAKYLNELKLDPSFIKAGDMSQDMLIKDAVGMVDGIPLVRTKSAWLSGADCLIAHRSATVAPIKLEEYKVITDSEFYSGTVFAGRLYYDAFVLNNKAVGLASIGTVAAGFAVPKMGKTK